MKNFLTRLSRRERLYVIAAAAALFSAVVLYPAFRASSAYRQEKIEELEAARALRATYQTMLRTAEQIRTENSDLKEALSRADGLLFDRIGNDVMMEAAVIKMLNQLAPDLSLDISIARPSLRATPGQLNFSVRGTGRYPEILNFFYLLETHRPLIVVDHFSMAVQNSKRAVAQKAKVPPQAAALRKTPEAEPSEPRIKLQMDIHINCRTAGGGK
jgi:hypothetical protein